jgi:hypothetical protein
VRTPTERLRAALRIARAALRRFKHEPAALNRQRMVHALGLLQRAWSALQNHQTRRAAR